MNRLEELKAHYKYKKGEMGTKEFEFEICGETEDCKNKLWKLGKT